MAESPAAAPASGGQAPPSTDKQAAAPAPGAGPGAS